MTGQITIRGFYAPASSGPDDRHCRLCGLELARCEALCRSCVLSQGDRLQDVIRGAGGSTLAARTVQAYLLAIRGWVTWSAGAGVGVDELTPDALTRWVVAMDESGRKPGAIRATVSHLRGAVALLDVAGVPGRWSWPMFDPNWRAIARRIQASARGTARSAAPLRVDELGALIASVRRSPDEDAAIRDAAILLLWWSIAGRSEEIPWIRWRDIARTTDGGWDVFVSAGKGKAARRATVYPAVRPELCPIAALERLAELELGARLSELWSRPADEVDGLERPIAGLSHRGVRAMVERRLEDAGLTGFTPHSFRVGPLVVALEAGAVREEIKLVSGHASGAQLETYLRSVARGRSVAFRLL